MGNSSQIGHEVDSSGVEKSTINSPVPVEEDLTASVPSWCCERLKVRSQQLHTSDPQGKELLVKARNTFADMASAVGPVLKALQ